MPRSADISPTPLWLVPVALAGGIIAANVYGRGPFFLVLAAAALGGAIWVFWRSLQSLTGEAPLTLDEALGLGAPAAEEERKTAVLRALKDLEYERSVGKIDEQDFMELSEKYRAEARMLLQLVDENLGSARRDALASLEKRIDAELGPNTSDPSDKPELQGTEVVEDDDAQDDDAASNSEKSSKPVEPAVANTADSDEERRNG